MAKTIKFNLICEKKPIRTIEDLQNNFSIEDVLNYFENGLLRRWLEVRGYHEELKAVELIEEKDPMEIVKKLIEIFKIEIDSKKVEENVYIFQYLKERKELFDLYEKAEYQHKKVVDDYYRGYKSLVNDILENSNDIVKIKMDIANITNDYSWIFELDHRRLFYLFKYRSPIAIMCLLMNRKTRDYYIMDEKPENHCIINENLENLSGLDRLLQKNMNVKAYKETFQAAINKDKNEMYEEICRMIETEKFRKQLGDSLLSFSDSTNGFWKDLEPKGQEYMIVYMYSGAHVRPAGVQRGDLPSSDRYKFIIVDGIDYMSNSNNNPLYYMEV